MTLPEKSAVGIGAALMLLLIAIHCAYDWANIPPNRPPGVPANAVFLWAPHVGVPSPKRGDWLNCWEDKAGRDQCRLTRQDGRTAYQGEFRPYQGAVASTAELEIDSEKSREQKVWIGDELVPIIYLKNHAILFPAEKYSDAAHLLDKRN